MSSISTPTNTTPPSPSWTPGLTYLFSATVILGGTFGPIPLLDGSSRVVEVISGGTITGPGFNATISGGLAAPILVANNTDSNATTTTTTTTTTAATTYKAQLPFVYAYGYADDGSPFYMDEFGVGTSAVQNTRLNIQVGGKYQDLQTMFVLGQPAVNAARTEAKVECWSVPLPS